MKAAGTPAFLWLPEIPAPGVDCALVQEDAHYVARVCRVEIGERMRATDGAGTVADLSLVANRGEVRVRVESSHREPRPAWSVVACGAPEKDRADWLIEKLAELGVSEFQPLDCERGRWDRLHTRRDRWQRLAVAALRQSCRAWLLTVKDSRTPGGWMAELEGKGSRWLADPEGESAVPAGIAEAKRVVPADSRPEGVAPGPGDIDRVAVGPASGFSRIEREQFQKAGFRPVRLSAGRLRTETAALSWASIWSAGVAGSPAPEAP